MPCDANANGTRARVQPDVKSSDYSNTNDREV
jgi:hypothetical protein